MNNEYFKAKNLEEHLIKEIVAVEKQKGAIEANLLNKQDKLKAVRAELSRMTKEPTRVSEHALVRYLERITGIEMAQIERAILPEEWRKKITSQGEGIYLLGTHKIIVRNNTVVTVLSNDQQID